MKYTQASFDLFVQSLSNEQKFFLGREINDSKEHSISRLETLINEWFNALSEDQKKKYAHSSLQSFSVDIASPYQSH
jgi:hypothetical protein